MMITLRNLTLAVFLVNLVLMTYTAFIFIFLPKESSSVEKGARYLIRLINGSDNSDEYNWRKLENSQVPNKESNELNRAKVGGARQNSHPDEPLNVLEIWSKAAIGFYLWEHLLRGRLSKKGQHYQYGLRKIDGFQVKFRGGSSLTPQSLENFLTTEEDPKSPGRPKNLILILNGRSKEKIDFSKQWLDTVESLTNRKGVKPFNVGAILLGHESCFNSWVEHFLSSRGGPLKFLFVVYDWKEIDNREVYQWPLGVATYRNFPNPDPLKLNLKLERPYTCNFLGTVYPNSSRTELMEVIKTLDEGTCFTKGRSEWEPNETSESLDVYLRALQLSDLTLSPIGMNHECYRIYEALAYGSLPVVEENLNHVKGHKSNCDSTSTYRLLKKYNAPVIYVANWTHELPTLLEKEMSLSLEHKISRRYRIIEWYNTFKSNIRDHFLDVIEQRFQLYI